jgi:hypothetical protein
MFAGINLTQVAGAAFVGLSVFAGGAYLMVNEAVDNQSPMPTLAVVNPGTPPATLVYKPAVAPTPAAEQRAPAERKKAKAYRSPTDWPAEADALALLGMIAEVKVTRRQAGKDPRFDALVRDAHRLVGEDVYPGAIAAARRLRQSPRAEYLVITPSNTPSIWQIVEVLGEAKSTQADLGIAETRRLTWHYYSWLSFATVGGRVTAVRLDCQTVPGFGLGVK